METIVVGVDGSDGSTAALEFAAEEAALREAPLRIVAAWDVPAAVYGSGVDSEAASRSTHGWRHSTPSSSCRPPEGSTAGP